MEDKYKGGFTENDKFRILPNFDFASLYPATQRYFINDDRQISLLHELARKRQLLRLKEQRKKKLEKINNL